MKKISASAAFIWSVGAVLVIGLIYGLTLFAPLPNIDDAGFVDYAMHGRFKLWDQLLPASLQLRENVLAVGWVPGCLWMIKTMISTLGLGVWQPRLFPCLFGVIALLLLIVLIRRLRLPLLCYLTPPIMAISHYFFMSTHTFRMETFILCVGLIQIFWLTSTVRPWWSLGAGCLSALSLAWYPTGVFALGAMPFLWFFSPLKRDGSAIAWWFVGAFLGSVIVAHWIDIEQVVLYAALVGGVNLLPPPIFLWKWDLPAIFFEWVLYLARTTVQNPFWYGVILLSLSFVAGAVRRWKSLNVHIQFVLLVLIILSMSFAALSGSVNSTYLIFFLPWFLLVFAMGVDWILKEGSLDSTDLFMAATVALLVGSAAFGPAFQYGKPLFWVTPITIFSCIVWLRYLFIVPRRYAVAAAILIWLSTLPYPWFPQFTVKKLVLLVQRGPWFGIGCLLFPVLVGSLALWRWSYRSVLWLLIPVCLCGAVGSSILEEVKLVRYSLRVASVIKQVAQESKTYAEPLIPGFFMFYRHDTDFKSIDGLTWVRDFLPTYRILPRIRELNPAYMICSIQAIGYLEAERGLFPNHQAWLQKRFEQPVAIPYDIGPISIFHPKQADAER